LEASAGGSLREVEEALEMVEARLLGRRDVAVAGESRRRAAVVSVSLPRIAVIHTW
jgi:hypothetical protein